MRLYKTVREAISEIERDLIKAPRVKNTRVQNVRVDNIMHEAMNYSYTILPGGIPHEAADIVELAAGFSPFWREKDLMTWWLEAELAERLDPLTHLGDDPADLQHPALGGLAHRGTFDYIYRDRMIGMIPALATALEKDPQSRRAYWQFFSQYDSIRAHQDLRIPCSIGWEAMIRQISGRGDFLHMTYVQRSCDFYRFWISDLWFAYRIQAALWDELFNRGMDLTMGQISHLILSFHYFEEEGREVY